MPHINIKSISVRVIMNRFISLFCCLFFLAFLNGTLSDILYQRAVAEGVSCLEAEKDEIRRMDIGSSYLSVLKRLEAESGRPPSEFLTACMAYGNGRIPSALLDFDTMDYLRLKHLFLQYNRSGYERLNKVYRAVWDDAAVFPVAEDGIVYENSWMFERTYGGPRGHEGVDLMPPENLPGYYRVVSMTDGIVEKIGWLEKGGYRIGIRSPSGGYFYYAHLDSYAQDFPVGQWVEAGELLGYMGDSGYGPEGTRGKFKVHLHLGIYIKTERTEELSVNPYWILKHLS